MEVVAVKVVSIGALPQVVGGVWYKGQQAVATGFENFTSPSLRVVSQGAHLGGATDQGLAAGTNNTAAISTNIQQAVNAPMVRSEVVPPTLVGLQDAQSISADTQTIMTPVIQPATSVGVDQVSPNVPVDNSPRFASQELGSGGAEPQRSNAHSTDIGVLEPNCSVRSEAQQGNNPVGSTSNDVGPSYVELNTKNSHTMLMRSKMNECTSFKVIVSLDIFKKNGSKLVLQFQRSRRMLRLMEVVAVKAVSIGALPQVVEGVWCNSVIPVKDN
ncbi:hypothetical protein V6N11_033922 [Hibiscus sabdariffa]|uniref:Uncharacterized protein n=1 Tax=Hibiscus sabdariffa TaxID=183260 RepID=A0ABR2S1T6_9ROSI